MGKLCVCPRRPVRAGVFLGWSVKAGTFYDMYSLRLGLIMLIKCNWSSEIESQEAEYFKNVTLINSKCGLLWGSEAKNGAYKVRGGGYLQELIEILLTIPRST